MRKRTLVTAATVAIPLTIALAPAAGASQTALPTYEAYHGASSKWHSATFDKLVKKGYRLTSISVDDAADPKYTAVWVKASGPAWVSYTQMSPAQYQKIFTQYTAKGYQPTMVSATGSGNDAVFAAIFQKIGGRFQARHGMSEKDFMAAHARFTRQGYTLSSVNAYGTAEMPLYAAVWSTGESTQVSVGLTPAQHGKEFEARKKRASVRGWSPSRPTTPTPPSGGRGSRASRGWSTSTCRPPTTSPSTTS